MGRAFLLLYDRIIGKPLEFSEARKATHCPEEAAVLSILRRLLQPLKPNLLRFRVLELCGEVEYCLGQARLDWMW